VSCCCSKHKSGAVDRWKNENYNSREYLYREIILLNFNSMCTYSRITLVAVFLQLMLHNTGSVHCNSLMISHWIIKDFTWVVESRQIECKKDSVRAWQHQWMTDHQKPIAFYLSVWANEVVHVSNIIYSQVIDIFKLQQQQGQIQEGWRGSWRLVCKECFSQCLRVELRLITSTWFYLR